MIRGNLAYSRMSYFRFISYTSSRLGVPNTFMISISWSIWLSPMKGGEPFIIYTSTHPADHMSIWGV